MIVTREKHGRYHLAYLRRLEILKKGECHDVLLEDDHHRVALSRLGVDDGMDYDNQVIVEVVADRRIVAVYPADEGPRYCMPVNCGLASESSAVARKLTNLLGALSSIDRRMLESESAIINDCDELSIKLKGTLLAQGWHIVAAGDNWKVLPPNGKRNDHG